MKNFLSIFKRKKKIAYLGEIAKVRVSEGDTVVLTVPGKADSDQMKAIADVWESRFGDSVQLLVISDGMKIAVLSPEVKAKKFEKDQEEEAIASLVEQLS